MQSLCSLAHLVEEFAHKGLFLFRYQAQLLDAALNGAFLDKVLEPEGFSAFGRGDGASILFDDAL
jgi:hypothetical protein